MSDELEDRLRQSLQRAAGSVPPSGGLADRILAQADRPDNVTPLRPHRRRAVVLPLVAAAAVVAVVVGLVFGTRVGRQDAAPAATATASPPVATVTRTASPSSTPSTSAPASPSSPAPSSAFVPPAGGPVPSGTQVTDLTAINSSDLWALGSGLGSDGTRSAALVRSTNGGTSWVGLPVPGHVQVGSTCASPCVTHVRFANASTGYVFGPDALFMTTDGGEHWTKQSGGALALESLDDNVIRTSQPVSGGPLVVQTAAIGSSVWTTRTLPAAAAPVTGAQLTRTGRAAYLLATGDLAGNAQSPRSTLYTSTDGGVSWSAATEPCTPSGTSQARYSIGLGSGADGTVALACTTRTSAGVTVARTFTAGGALAYPPGQVSGSSTDAVVALGGAQGSGAERTFLGTAGALWSSSDDGASFAKVAGVGAVSFIGFQSDQDGRALSVDGRTVWTTDDGGSNWTGRTIQG